MTLRHKIAFMLCVLALIACQKEPVSTTDPLPMPPGIDESKDTSRKPGDSFYDYCNGTWLKNTPIPAQRATGPMYDQSLVIDKLLEELKASDPDIAHYYKLRDAASGNPEASKAYLDAIKAKFPKPATPEEYYISFGKMIAEGIYPSWDSPLLPVFNLAWVDGVQKGMITPIIDEIPFDLPTTPDPGNPFRTPVPEPVFSSLTPVSATKAGLSAESLIIQGMGLDPANFVTDPEWDKFWKKMNGKSLEELQVIWDETWANYEKYGADTLSDITRASADLSLGYTRSYHFVQKNVPPRLKEKILGITKDIQASLRNRIQQVEWMSETTKSNAIDKLDHCGLHVMYPDKWYADCIPDVSECKTLVEFVQKANKGIFNLRRQLIGTADIFSQQITKGNFTDDFYIPVDLTFVNAFYSPEHNAILIYPALFLPPMLPEGVSEAYEYAVFMIIGHEFTHGFDNVGSMYDKFGNKKNWWTVADKMSFEERSALFADCHNHLEIDPVRKPGIYNDGKITLHENIADLGGFLTALDTYMVHLDRDGYTGETRNEQLRKFYESFAHFWQVQYSDASLEIFPKKDTHSIARLRVNGVVMNTDLWYELYHVDRNCHLFLPEERRAYIW